MLIFLFLCVISFFISRGHTNYEGYKVYEIIPKSLNQNEILARFANSPEKFDFWKLSKIPNDSGHVMVSPKYQQELENILKIEGVEYKVIDNNLQKTVELQKLSSIFLRTVSSRVDFSRFYRFNEINGYLDNLASNYKSIVNVTAVGKSYEGRIVKIITVSNGENQSGKKKIFVDAGIHAREWIAPTTALYIIYQLVENFEENQDLLKNFDWIILPVVNPDGYEYTHTRERFWRKTRSQGIICQGTDGNRNFDFHWGEVGTSGSQCSEIYRGIKPFSEPETQIVQKILRAEKGSCKFYLTLHSYGRYLLYPWGWTSELPETWKDLDEVAQAGAEAMRNVTGAIYRVGSSTNVLYAAAGGSDDYAFGVEDVPISVTMELPGNSFNPPSSEIKPMIIEAWTGIKAMFKKVEEKYEL